MFDAMGIALRRLLRQVQQSPFASGQLNQARPNADPALQVAGSAFSFYNTARIVIGRITDSTSICNGYRVQFEKMLAPMTCYLSTHTSLSAFGAHELNTLQPGTPVICMVHDQLIHGAILGVMPFGASDTDRTLADQISQAGRTRTDAAHQWPVRSIGNGTLGDWLGGRPLDLTTGGEWGAISETGIRVLVDSFMFQAAVDEMCGIFGFYHDQLLRIAAYNLQVWTAGHEREALDDQGEYNDYSGFTPYPWEQLGQFTRVDPHVENSGQAWQIDEPHKAAWEPKDDRQRPWHRTQEFRGYLGQGLKQMVVAAPQNPPGANAYGAAQEFIGLYDHNVGLDGRSFTQTAKGFSLVKRLGIIVPDRVERPEQPEPVGDNPKNYRAAGLEGQGDGPEHTITGDLTADYELPQLQRAAGLLDLHAYLFNYSGVHPFFWHKRDWAVSDEAGLPYTNGQASVPPNFSELGGAQYMQPPSPLQLKIDHRYKEQKYFPNECGIVGLEDGGLVFFDGFGSSIVMSGGNITLSAPGDIFLKSGRNTVTWAGHDLIMRAKNSADLSVTDKDVRIKANLNMQLMSEDGGILLESRATGDNFGFEGKVGEDVQSSGIMFRSPNASVTTWASSIYLRTGGGDVQDGDIMIDAAKGQRNIFTNSDTFQTFVGTSVNQWFGAEGEITAGNIFREDGYALKGQGQLDGPMFIAGMIITKGNILVTQGNIVTEKAKSANYMVLPLEGVGLNQANDAISRVTSTAAQTLPEEGKNLYTGDLQTQFYDSQRPGNDTVIENAQFSFRTTEQYKTTDFKIFEDRWQQMARLGGNSMPTWEEKAVETRTDPETYPYPGKDAFQGDALLQQDLTLFDAAGGNANGRGEAPDLAVAYKEPAFSEPQPTSLNNYQIVVRT